MLPSDYDLRLIEQRYFDLRAEAETYRRVSAAQKAAERHGVVGRLLRFVLVGGHDDHAVGSQKAAA